ncbi:MAG: hypothetical protein ACX939_14705, partial [Hyphococcus sp.]
MIRYIVLAAVILVAGCTTGQSIRNVPVKTGSNAARVEYIDPSVMEFVSLLEKGQYSVRDNAGLNAVFNNMMVFSVYEVQRAQDIRDEIPGIVEERTMVDDAATGAFTFFKKFPLINSISAISDESDRAGKVREYVRFRNNVWREQNVFLADLSDLSSRYQRFGVININAICDASDVRFIGDEKCTKLAELSDSTADIIQSYTGTIVFPLSKNTPLLAAFDY